MSILLKTLVFLRLQPLVRHTRNISVHVWCRVPVHPGIVSINSSLARDDNTLNNICSPSGLYEKRKATETQKKCKKTDSVPLLFGNKLLTVACAIVNPRHTSVRN